MLVSAALIYAPTNPEPTHRANTLMELSHFGPCTLTPNHFRCHLTGPAPVPQSLLKLFKLATPNPAHLPHPLVPVGTIIKALANISPHSLCLLTHPGGSHGKVYPLVLGTEKQVIFSMAIMKSPIGLAIHE